MKGLQRHVGIVRWVLLSGLCMELWNDQQQKKHRYIVQYTLHTVSRGHARPPVHVLLMHLLRVGAHTTGR